MGAAPGDRIAALGSVRGKAEQVVTLLPAMGADLEAAECPGLVQAAYDVEVRAMVLHADVTTVQRLTSSTGRGERT